jgi:hypothetical protein
MEEVGVPELERKMLKKWENGGRHYDRFVHERIEERLREGGDKESLWRYLESWEW